MAEDSKNFSFLTTQQHKFPSDVQHLFCIFFYLPSSRDKFLHDFYFCFTNNVLKFHWSSSEAHIYCRFRQISTKINYEKQNWVPWCAYTEKGHRQFLFDWNWITQRAFFLNVLSVTLNSRMFTRTLSTFNLNTQILTIWDIFTRKKNKTILTPSYIKQRSARRRLSCALTKLIIIA